MRILQQIIESGVMYLFQLCAAQDEDPGSLDADPQRAPAVAKERGNRFSGRQTGGAESIQMSMLPHRQPRFGSDPNPSCAVLSQGIDRIRWESVLLGER